MRHADYASALRPLLPKEAFELAPRKLWLVAIHGLVVAGGWIAFRFVGPLVYPLLALVIGHSMACIAFVAHELSHGAVIRKRSLVYPLELFMWGINAISPTVWRRVHNQTHHLYANSPKDPDRRYLESERSPATVAYSFLLYPSRFFQQNPLPFFHFVPYILRNTIAVFYSKGVKPALVPFKPEYSTEERIRVALELVFIAALQVGVYFISGANLAAYLWAGPMPLLVASATIMIYVFTNHFINELDDGEDPVAGTTSVIVPSFWNRLHSNFSYHTEHHVFPNMSSDYYPQVGILLARYFPQSYHRVPLHMAWRELWQADLLTKPKAAGPTDGTMDQPQLQSVG